MLRALMGMGAGGAKAGAAAPPASTATAQVKNKGKEPQQPKVPEQKRGGHQKHERQRVQPPSVQFEEEEESEEEVAAAEEEEAGQEPEEEEEQQAAEEDEESEAHDIVDEEEEVEEVAGQDNREAAEEDEELLRQEEEEADEAEEVPSIESVCGEKSFSKAWTAMIQHCTKSRLPLPDRIARNAFEEWFYEHVYLLDWVAKRNALAAAKAEPVRGAPRRRSAKKH